MSPISLLRSAFAFCALTATAADWVPLPDGGEPMFPVDPIPVLRLSGSSSLAKAEVVPVDGMPFDRAFKVTVTGKPVQQWDVQILGTTTGDVRSGDVLLMSLFVRGSSPMNETGEGQATAYLQRNSGAYEKVVAMPVTAGPEWKQYLLPATANLTLGPGQHNFTIFLGFFQQTVEVGGVSLVNFRNTRTLAELPRTKITYPGSEADAQWRKEADAAIETIRKADLKVVVLDAAGKPVEGADVAVTQKKHEFGFGSAVAADGIFANNADGDRYREVIRTWFNKVVLENDLKWPSWEANRGKALNALAWLRDNGINNVRGHTLVWPGWSRCPTDVQTLASDPEKLRARVLNHIEDELRATEGQLVDWDVINEPFTNTDIQKVLGDREMAEWFKKARQHEPSAVLYVNDYSILTGGGNDRAHQDHYFETIGKLIEWGAPLGGIGMQGHFGAQLTAPTRVWQILDRFSTYGKLIHITEFDIDVEDEEIQGQYTRDFMTTVFAHPSVTGFMMWGFWEGRHWKPRAAMFRRDWSLKPNAQAYLELVFDKWWTRVRGNTGGSGEFATRAFKGEHEVTVTHGSTSLTRSVTLDWRGAELTVRLP